MGKFSPNLTANSLLAFKKYNPGGRVLISEEGAITWDRFTDRVLMMGRALAGLGIKKDHKVAFMFHNNARFVETNLGIQVAGAVPVPVNYRFTSKEIINQVNHSDARVFIYDSIWEEQAGSAVKKLKQVKHLVCCGKKGNKKAIDYDEFIALAKSEDPRVPTSLDDAAAMIYTGGTTGFPKGVLLSYGAHIEMLAGFNAALFANILTGVPAKKLKGIINSLELPAASLLAYAISNRASRALLKRPWFMNSLKSLFARMMKKPESARLRYRSTLKLMFPTMPFFHDASYQILMLQALMGNICIILIPGHNFDPVKTLDVARAEKPLLMANVPVGWKKIVETAPAGDPGNDYLLIAATGAGVLPVDLKRKILKTFKKSSIVDIMGQTEMTPVTALKLDTDESTLKERSVGRTIVEVKIVDEKGREMPAGKTGEIMYRSGTMMLGYYKDDKATREAMQDGWFRSGDLGYIDEDGEVRLVDRLKECINTGGEKVFPMEVEEVIEKHAGVYKVCVIGIPDSDWGSAVRAVVQPRAGKKIKEKEIVDFCRGKIAGYKIPKSVVFVKEIPLSPVGKVLRAKVREKYGR